MTCQPIQIILPRQVPAAQKEEFDLVIKAIRETLSGDITLGDLDNADFCSGQKSSICPTELYEDLLAACAESIYSQIKNMLLSPRRVIWVTRGAALECSRPSSSLFVGLARAIRSGKPGQNITILDIEEDQTLSNLYKFAHTLKDMCHMSTDKKLPFCFESEYALRDGKVYVSRLIENESLNRILEASVKTGKREKQPFFQDGRPLQLSAGTSGVWRLFTLQIRRMMIIYWQQIKN